MRGRSKHGGFTGNLVKLGGSRRKLALSSDMKSDSLVHSTRKKGSKQAHKRA